MSMRNPRLRTITVVLLVILLTATLGGCCDTREGSRLKWEKVADGDGAGEEFWDGVVNFAYAGNEPRLIVVTDPAAVSTLQGRVSASHLDLVADVSFSSNWVAVVYQGRQEGDYHPIEVNDVRLQESTVTIHAGFYQPTPNKYQTFTAKVSPYYILKIEKPTGIEEKEIAFTLDAGGQIVSQICAVEGERLPWEKIVFDRGADIRWSYGETSPQLAVVVDREALSSVRDYLPPEHLELVAGIDFSTYFAAIIYQGRKMETAYSVEVIDVRQEEGEIVLCARFHEPVLDEVRGQAVTSPYFVMKIERPRGAREVFSFVLLDGDEEIIRQVETIP